MRLGPRTRTLLLAGAAFLLAVLVGGFLKFKKFVDEDPRLCATCHRASPEFALWLGGSHRDVSCQKCHHATQEEGVAMLRAFLAGKKPQGKHAEVEVGTCAACHLSHDSRWPQIGQSRGHKVHFEQQKITCVRCHATSVHGFEPVSASCVSCHGKHLLRLPRVPHHRGRPAPDPARLHALPLGAGHPRPHERPRRRHGDGLRRLPQAARAARPGPAGLHRVPPGDGEGRPARQAGPRPLPRLPPAAHLAGGGGGLPALPPAGPRPRPAPGLRRLPPLRRRPAAAPRARAPVSDP
jgi:hypothetical protein